MSQFGRMADLARRLGVTNAAVSKAFKKHGIQRSADGFYDLDYLDFLFKSKQDQAKSAGQRAKAKQPPNIKNPAAIRLVVSGLHDVFNAAIKNSVFEAFQLEEEGNENDGLTPKATLDEALLFWLNFREAFDAKYPPGVGDHELAYPSLAADCLQHDEPSGDIIGRLRLEYNGDTKAQPPIGVVMAGAG